MFWPGLVSDQYVPQISIKDTHLLQAKLIVQHEDKHFYCAGFSGPALVYTCVHVGLMPSVLSMTQHSNCVAVSPVLTLRACKLYTCINCFSTQCHASCIATKQATQETGITSFAVTHDQPMVSQHGQAVENSADVQLHAEAKTFLSCMTNPPA